MRRFGLAIALAVLNSLQPLSIRSQDAASSQELGPVRSNAEDQHTLGMLESLSVDDTIAFINLRIAGSFETNYTVGETFIRSNQRLSYDSGTLRVDLDAVESRSRERQHITDTVEISNLGEVGIKKPNVAETPVYRVTVLCKRAAYGWESFQSDFPSSNRKAGFRELQVAVPDQDNVQLVSSALTHLIKLTQTMASVGGPNQNIQNSTTSSNGTSLANSRALENPGLNDEPGFALYIKQLSVPQRVTVLNSEIASHPSSHFVDSCREEVLWLTGQNDPALAQPLLAHNSRNVNVLVLAVRALLNPKPDRKTLLTSSTTRRIALAGLLSDQGMAELQKPQTTLGLADQEQRLIWTKETFASALRWNQELQAQVLQAQRNQQDDTTVDQELDAHSETYGRILSTDTDMQVREILKSVTIVWNTKHSTPEAKTLPKVVLPNNHALELDELAHLTACRGDSVASQYLNYGTYPPDSTEQFCTHFGQDLLKDENYPAVALDYFHMACEGGHNFGCLRMLVAEKRVGEQASSTGDSKLARRAFRRACLDGDPYACETLNEQFNGNFDVQAAQRIRDGLERSFQEDLAAERELMRRAQAQQTSDEQQAIAQASSTQSSFADLLAHALNDNTIQQSLKVQLNQLAAAARNAPQNSQGSNLQPSAPTPTMAYGLNAQRQSSQLGSNSGGASRPSGTGSVSGVSNPTSDGSGSSSPGSASAGTGCVLVVNLVSVTSQWRTGVGALNNEVTVSMTNNATFPVSVMVRYYKNGKFDPNSGGLVNLGPGQTLGGEYAGLYDSGDDSSAVQYIAYRENSTDTNGNSCIGLPW